MSSDTLFRSGALLVLALGMEGQRSELDGADAAQGRRAEQTERA